MKPSLTHCLVVCAVAIGVGCGRTPDPSAPTDGHRTLTLYVASSLTDVVEEIGEDFSESQTVDLVYNVAGSGALAQQIMASPRTDLFLSASEHWMDEVEAAERLLPDSRRTLFSNQLTIIANAGSDFSINMPADLADLPLRFLAIGDPDAVPVGRYAKEWLGSLHASDRRTVWERVEDRISPAPDARAVLAQVEGSRDVVGIVYHTDYLARRDAVRLLYRVPVDAGPSIRYSVAVVREAGSADLAQAFVAHLTSPEAQAVLERHGFTLLTGSGTLQQTSH